MVWRWIRVFILFFEGVYSSDPSDLPAWSISGIQAWVTSTTNLLPSPFPSSCQVLFWRNIPFLACLHFLTLRSANPLEFKPSVSCTIILQLKKIFLWQGPLSTRCYISIIYCEHILFTMLFVSYTCLWLELIIIPLPHFVGHGSNWKICYSFVGRRPLSKVFLE